MVALFVIEINPSALVGEYGNTALQKLFALLTDESYDAIDKRN